MTDFELTCLMASTIHAALLSHDRSLPSGVNLIRMQGIAVAEAVALQDAVLAFGELSAERQAEHGAALRAADYYQQRAPKGKGYGPAESH